MKSERRHELQHNELADWLAATGENIKPYQNAIFLSLLGILVVVGGYTWWARQSAAETTAAWDEINAVIESGNMDKLAKAVEDYAGTSAAHTAALVLADYHLAEGCDRRFVAKETAQQELTKAIELYQTVREQSSVPAMTERATFGEARAREVKGGDAGDLQPAIQLYKDVAAKWPNGAYAVAATDRLADLQRPATKRFYDDFKNFDPKPAFAPATGEKPNFDLNSLPGEGPAYMPETTYDLKLGDKDKDGKAAEKKSDGKAAEKKSGEKPSDSLKGSGDKTPGKDADKPTPSAK